MTSTVLMMLLAFLASGVAVATVVVVILVRASRGFRAQWRRNRRNREATPAQWAQDHQWAYNQASPDLPLDADIALTNLHGARQYAEIVSGSVREMPAASWIHTEWRSGTRRRSEEVSHRVAALRVPWSVPRISLTPAVDELSHAANAWVNTAKRVVLEGERFNQAWFVSADDPRTASSVLHPRVMERLLLPDALPADDASHTLDKTYLHFLGHHLYAWRPYRTDVDHLDELFRLLGDLYDLTPEHIRRER